jgi:hypothetical protein
MTPPLPANAEHQERVMSKRFDTADALGAITGVLLSKIDGIYEVCNYASGESVFTHQLPRVGSDLQVGIVKRRPDLGVAVEESKQVTGQNYKDWLAKWRDRYGDTIEIFPLSADEHERIDPLSELAEKIHPSKILVVKVEGGS